MLTEEMNRQKENYYQLIIGDKGDEYEVWVKKLRYILENDIHSRSIGCKLNDTHMKIGGIHMESFYEARIIFSHIYWINKFARWLDSIIGKRSTNVVIIGYEKYIEPVLCTLRQFRNRKQFFYGIYEEAKYTQNKGYIKEESSIRYLDNLCIDEDSEVFFLCGISSTLKTFQSMKREVKAKYKKRNIDEIIDKAKCISIIQVLPQNDEEGLFGLTKATTKTNERKLINTNIGIEATYLVDVYCKWHKAENCKLCYGENGNFTLEKPIIETSETSVIPVQMLDTSSVYRKEKQNSNQIGVTVDFFAKVKETGEYIYRDNLYYTHLDRMDHHYKYYVRTSHLVNDIIDRDSQTFIKISTNIKRKIESNKQDVVDVIVYPSDWSEGIFPNAVNQYVFDNKAHILPVDSKKEFRKNFEIKYSNFSYFIEQLYNTKSHDNCILKFHYVSKELAAVESFARVKSLVRTLIQEAQEKLKEQGKIRETVKLNTEIFSDVIVFLSRFSQKSKEDYVKSADFFYSYLNLDVPSLRNFGDSCPICKARQDAMAYTRKSCLGISAEHWKSKFDYYEPKSIEEAKKFCNDKNENIKSRHFRRLECENLLWKEIKKCDTKREYSHAISSLINKNNDYEYILSFIKAISSPFLFYRENEKKAALSFLLLTMKSILDLGAAIGTLSFYLEGKKVCLELQNKYETYNLLIVVMNRLSEMDSSFILSTDVIEQICRFVEENVSPHLLTFKDVSCEVLGTVCGDEVLNFKKDGTITGLYADILFSFKRAICGIGGIEKCKHVDIQLEKHLEQEKYRDLFIRLYIENNVVPRELSKELLDSFLLNKYTDISTEIEKIVDEEHEKIQAIYFIYYQAEKNRCYELRTNAIPRDFNEIKSCCDEKTGIYFEDGSCTVSLDIYLVDNNSGSASNDNSPDRLFLRIDFKEKNVNENYRLVRAVLSFRYWLTQVIDKDIKTKSFSSAIQAERATSLIGSEKTLSHGGVEEIINSWTFAVEWIDAWKESGDKRFFYNACKSVNMFMNRYISYYHTNKYIRDFSENGAKNVFANANANIDVLFDADDSGWFHSTGIDFLRYYLLEMGNGCSELWGKKIKLSPLSGKEELLTETIDKILDSIKEINRFPVFLKTNNERNAHAVIFLIGILDTLVRNAIEHGDKGDITVSFSMKNGDNPYYQFEIGNTYSSWDGKCQTGLTKPFFEGLNQLAEEEKVQANEKNKLINVDSGMDDGFRIEMTPQSDNCYTASITVYMGPLS